MEKQHKSIQIDCIESRQHMACELRSLYKKMHVFDNVRGLSQNIPQLEPNYLLNLMKDSPRGLLLHVYEATQEVLRLSRSHTGITRVEKNLAVAAVLYHDSLKLNINNNLVQRISQQDKYGHSIGIERIFQYFELPELAHAVRHNPLDFISDVTENRVTIPQLLLNIADRSNASGKPVTIAEKENILQLKMSGNEDFHREADILCSGLLQSAVKEENFRNLPYVTDDIYSTRRTILLQRFDEKYVEPRGKYKDTSSNYHMGRKLASFAHNTTIVHDHEGKIKAETFLAKKGEAVLHGIDGRKKDVIEELVRLSHSHDSIIIEGWTSVLPILREKIDNQKSIILLMRAMSGGKFEDERLLNALYADEIWVMTEQMRQIIYEQFQPLSSPGLRIPRIRILTSGVDDDIFFADEKIKRQQGKITYVGGITKLKGVDVLLDAFDLVKQEFPHAELHLIGDPAIYGKKNEFDKQTLRKDGVVYHGALIAEEVAEQLKTAHVSVLLTRIFEAYGKAAMQARVCGTPMVVSDQGALPLHVQKEEEGIVLKDINPAFVADALKTMLSNEPRTVLPPVDRYHTWQKTAVDFATNLSLCKREIISEKITHQIQ